jgi:mono/diheme cytochrome c family protein
MTMSNINNHRTLPMMRRAFATAGLALCLASTAGAAFAQRGGGFTEQTGEDIYKGICQGCHMPDAKGAQGAGMYPALAGDKKLAAKAYPALVIVRGQKAMPSFNGLLNDAQVANVVNYIRSNFGNAYPDAITADEVRALHPAKADTGVVRPPG